MQTEFFHEFYRNLFSTLIAFVVISLVSIIVTAIISRKIESQRKRTRIKIRSLYVAIIVFLFIVARIWVEGFTHLLAVLGLVSAALVVTNKETIMNFVGWLIITWRELFVEDDLVQVQQYTGYVKNIGVLYFTLAEVSALTPDRITGRMIRVPNGLISNNALINFSQVSHLLQQSVQMKIKIDEHISIELRLQEIQKEVDKILQKYYQNKPQYCVDYIQKKNKTLQNFISLATNISVTAYSKDNDILEITINFYCFSKDANELKNQIYIQLKT